MSHLFVGHVATRVRHGKIYPFLAVFGIPADRQRDRPLLGEFAGVAEQVEQSLPNLGGIGMDGPD